VEWQGVRRREHPNLQLLGNDRDVVEKKLLTAKCAKNSQRSRRKQNRELTTKGRHGCDAGRASI
jgi:hypothetical protein